MDLAIKDVVVEDKLKKDETMLNSARLIGNLGKNPELKYTASGQPIANFSVATSENWKDKQGAKQQKTTWHNIVIWGKLAEVANQYLTKGSTVYLEGKIDNRSYDDKDGNKRYVSEIVCDKMIMLGGKGSKAETHRDEGTVFADGGTATPEENDLPF